MRTDKDIMMQAKWIWPNGNLYLVNCFARFRYDFELERLPVHAPLLVTADQSYRLYVNGHYVCRGPARGYQSNWPYDRVDIGAFLKCGHNWLAVEAYTPGISTFSYVHQGHAGFLCAAEWENGTRIASNETEWNIGRSTGHNPHTARLTKQMNFQEDFDAVLDDGLWITSESFDPDWFAQPVWADREYACCFGQPPYYDVEERAIPMLEERLMTPGALVCRGEGPAASGYRDAENIAWFFSENEHPAMTYRPAGEFLQTDDGFCRFELPATGSGKAASATFDLGEEWLPGTLLMEVEHAAGGEIVDVFYHQYLETGSPEFITPGVSSLNALASRLRLPAGGCRHEFFHLMGTRQFTVLARETTQPLVLKIVWRSATYPMEMQGDFHSSDPELNDIWRICRHTQKTCSLDAFVDTPWREQAQWWGDARIQAKNFYYLTGDSRLLRRGIRSIAGQENRYGLTYGHAPTSAGNCILPDFSITWIITVFDDWFQTGNLELFHEQHDRIKAILSYFESIRGTNGLLPHDRRFWLFEDWADLPKAGFPCFLNLWFLYGLECYRRLLLAADDRDGAERVTAECSILRTRLVAEFYDPGEKLFFPCISEAGNVFGVPSCHDQVLAILLQLTPEAWEHMAAVRILPVLRGEAVPGAVPSAFWASYLLEAARLLEFRNEALAYIRMRWKQMIPSGTTWEVFERGEYPWSLCHAWSAHPLTHIPDLLSGIRQLAPAWREVLFDPLVPPVPAAFETTVPTPSGNISASCRIEENMAHFQFRAPVGTAVRIRLPGKAEITCSGYPATDFHDALPVEQIRRHNIK